MTAADQPMVTIGVPVYNGEAMLCDMLESLRSQTFERFKVVICDNASSDATADIAKSFVERDRRFTYHRNPENIGAAPNFNRVYELEHDTPYYKWAAHDDIYAPTYLERCVAALEDDPDVVVAFPMTVMVDDTREGLAVDFMLLGDAVLDRFVDEAGRPAWTIGPLHLAESDDPARRLDDCLNRMAGSFEIFGVMRVAALERTQLHASYYGSDRALLAQLVCQGRFRQVPERLYVNRFHKAASRGMSREEQRNWIDTRRHVRWRIANMYRDILRAPSMAGLDRPTRLRCTGVALRNLASRYSRRFFGRLQRAAGRGRGDLARHADEVGSQNAA